ncbi:uncharacterized protein RJT20DRAFT_13791 [Scheffersomyces xylosifermentans]|uniref:uncharacterized protein n=1 Tax=Scheffersomyces xylosifermentans TaxID=1304137 RepID=UPI00315C5D15
MLSKQLIFRQSRHRALCFKSRGWSTASVVAIKLVRVPMQYPVQQPFQGFATSSFDKDIDYDIDLISLTKTPKKSPYDHKRFSFETVATLKGSSVDPEIIREAIRDIRQKDDATPNSASKDPLEFRKYLNEDPKGYLEFVERYFTELEVFSTFIQKSYGGKIRSFDQLTSIEVMNSLYIFKNYYSNNKINAVNKYNYITYNYMFERLLRYLNEDPSFPRLLSKSLIPKVQDKLVLVDLYKHGIGNFLNELQSLNKEFNFSDLGSLAQLSAEIKKTLSQFDQFVKTYSLVDGNFFKILIQINRYKSLNAILDSYPELTISHLLMILNDEQSLEINTRIKELSGEQAQVKSLVEATLPYLDLLVAIDEVEGSESFLTLAPQLFEKSKSNDPIISEAATKVLNTFLSLFNSGFISVDEASPFLASANGNIIDGKPYSLEDPVHNYELAQIWELNFPFGLLKLISIDSFQGLSKERILETAKEDLNEIQYSEFESSINSLVQLIPWTDFSILETILYDDQFRTWMYTREAPSTTTYSVAQETQAEQNTGTERSYAEIPDDLELDQFVDELTIFRDDILKGHFKQFTSSDILCSLEYHINEVYIEGECPSSHRMNKKNVFQFIRLQKRLERLFELNYGHTEALDVLLASSKKFVPLETPKSYVQLPEDLELHKFSSELEIFRDDELKKPFKDSTVEEINRLLDSRIDEVYHDVPNSDPNSRFGKENVYEFMRLSKRLTRLFNLNGGNTAVLDTLIHNQSVFDDVEMKIAAKNKEVEASPYVQIPDDMELHKFSKELEILRTDELKKAFAESSVEEINSLLDWRINEIVNNLPNSNPSSRLNDSNVFDFIRLSKRLARLFEINGGYTDTLDSLIHSQNVFEKFESEVLPKKKDEKESNMYKQLPDDFFLEEYIVELIQLKEELGIEKFSTVSSAQILQKLNELSNGEGSVSKKIIWGKLFRNLSLLFKHNHDNSFILDNVLINGEAFAKFESRKLFDDLISKHENSLIGQNSKIINDSFKYIEDFLNKSSLLEKSGIWELTDSEFEDVLEEYAAGLDKTSYDYPVVLDLIDELKNFNSKIDYYPNFLQQLYEIKSNNITKRLSDSDVEDMYKAFIENIEYEETKDNGVSQRIICPSKKTKVGIEEITTRQYRHFNDIDNDEGAVNSLKSDYNDSERLLSLLVKNEDPVDLESNEFLRGKFESEDEDVIRKAVSSALHDVDGAQESLDDLDAETIRKSYSKRGTRSVSSEVPSVDKGKIEDFLLKAKKEKELDQEREFRELKAYEWSNSMYNSNRSLESNNFFDPLDVESENAGLNIPKHHEYLLLDLEGQTIPFQREKVIKLPEEDIFKILNKFSKHDLNRFLRNFKRLQRRNWKLVGSQIDGDQKYLILARNEKSKRNIFYTRVKSVLATAGAVLLTLAGLNLWLDEETTKDTITAKPDTFTKIEEPIEIVTSQPHTPVVPQAIEKDDSSTKSFWKSFLWSEKE